MRARPGPIHGLCRGPRTTRSGRPSLPHRQPRPPSDRSQKGDPRCRRVPARGAVHAGPDISRGCDHPRGTGPSSPARPQSDIRPENHLSYKFDLQAASSAHVRRGPQPGPHPQLRQRPARRSPCINEHEKRPRSAHTHTPPPIPLKHLRSLEDPDFCFP